MMPSAASQFHWPNLLTYLAVSAAMVGIVFTDGSATRSWAGAGIAVAIAFDLFDGRFANTGGFVGLPSNISALFCPVLLLWVPGPLLAATMLVLAGAAAVSGFRIPRPNRGVLYTILAICVAVAGVHVFRVWA